LDLLSGLAALFVGWPGIITAIVMVRAGIYTKRIWLIILGAIFAAPITWYLGSTPRFRYNMYALPFFFLASALAVKLRNNRLAWIFTIPYLVMMGWLGFTVLSQ